MALARAQKRTLWGALSDSSIRRAAARCGLRNSLELDAAETQEALAKKRGDQQIIDNVAFFTRPELKRIARGLGFTVSDPKNADELRGELLSFVRAHSAKEKERLARRARLNPSSMTSEALSAIGQKLARPVLHLLPKRRGKIVAVWHEHDWWQYDRGPQIWLSVDPASHPATRSKKILELYVQPSISQVRVELRTGSLPAPAERRTRLYGHAALELPTLDVVFQRGPKRVGTWLAENEWKREWGCRDDFTDLEVTEDYQRAWRAEHPLEVGGPWAQLGGWPMSWEGEAAGDQLSDRFVLRTYRASQPWVEVAKRGREWLARARRR